MAATGIQIDTRPLAKIRAGRDSNVQALVADDPALKAAVKLPSLLPPST